MIDFEAEYNNRARVPDHEQVIAGWMSDAASYREAAACDLDIAYGDHERQKFDFFPANGRDDAPVVVFIHGGYWQALDRASVFAYGIRSGRTRAGYGNPFIPAGAGRKCPRHY